MNPFVLKAVVANSWVGGGQHYSHSVKPVRVSKPGGMTFSTKIARRYYEPPATNYDVPLFHYYQLGQLPPFLFGIQNLEKDAWVRTDQIMKDNEVLIQLVADNGIMLTPRDVWLKKTAIDNNFIMAIFQNPNFDYGTTLPYLKREDNDGLISTEDGGGIPINSGRYDPALIDILEFTIHFYSNNNYFSGTKRSNPDKYKMMYYDVANPKDEAEVLSFLGNYTDSLSLGWVNGNGFMYTLEAAKETPQTFSGRELGVYVDHTIVDKIYYPLMSALTYTDESTGVPQHCFRLAQEGIINKDDICVFVGVGDETNFKGVSLEIDPTKGLNQITNTEVSIGALQLTMAKHKFIATANVSDIKVLFVIRQSDNKKPTPFNILRLDLLDQLSIAERNDVMLKRVPFEPWYIGNLIQSKCNEFLYSKAWDLTDQLVLDNYGLTGLTNLVAKNPLVPKKEISNGVIYQVAMTDWAFREELHYRKDKLYLEVLPVSIEGHLLSSSYRPANFAGRLSFQNLPPCKLIETTLVKWYSTELKYQKKIQGDHVLTEDGEFFGFACYVTDDIASGNWVLAKKGLHYIVVEDKKKRTIVWDDVVLDNLGLQGRTVEGGKHVHLITYFNQHNSFKDFAEINILADDDGFIGIEPAQIDVWMDDYLLIEDLDYVVANGKIFIFWLGESKHSQIRIRMFGLSPTGKHLKPIQSGFVANGQIVFGEDIRRLTNKQLQISIAGRMYHKDEVGFGGSNKVTVDVSPGEPYMVKRLYPCLENFMKASTVDEWNKEKELEDQIIEFMGEYNPVPPSSFAGRPGLTRQRKIISGLISTLVYNFLYTEKYLNQEIKGSYTKTDVDGWLQDELYLVDVDITQQELFNELNVIVLPHRESFVGLSTAQFNFIKFVNNNYLNDRVTLSGYIIAN